MKKSIQGASALLLLSYLAMGCGTTVGNPEGPITLQSEGFAAVSAARMSLQDFARLPLAGLIDATAVTAFKFCVTRIKMKTEEGRSVFKDGSDSLDAKLGLIDLSNASATTPWGTINAPVDFRLRELRIELERDPDACSGADYSVAFNGENVRKNIEFRFEFEPSAALSAGDTLTLNIQAIAAALSAAETAGQLDDSHIDIHLNPNVKGSGREGN